MFVLLFNVNFMVSVNNLHNIGVSFHVMVFSMISFLIICIYRLHDFKGQVGRLMFRLLISVQTLNDIAKNSRSKMLIKIERFLMKVEVSVLFSSPPRGYYFLIPGSGSRRYPGS